MAQNSQTARSPGGGLASSQDGTVNVGLLLLKYLGLAALNAMALIMIYAFISDDNIGMTLVFAVVTIFANVVVFVPRMFPMRWIAPGLILMTLFVIYPVIYTVLTAFSNYGDGHLLPKGQVIELIEQQKFVPDDAQLYAWELYQDEAGAYALWLTGEDENGNPAVFFAPVGQPIEMVEAPPEEPPAQYLDYRLLSRGERTQALVVLETTIFGEGDDTAGVANRRQAARPLVQRYVYDGDRDVTLCTD